MDDNNNDYNIIKGYNNNKINNNLNNIIIIYYIYIYIYIYIYLNNKFMFYLRDMIQVFHHYQLNFHSK